MRLTRWLRKARRNGLLQLVAIVLIPLLTLLLQWVFQGRQYALSQQSSDDAVLLRVAELVTNDSNLDPTTQELLNRRIAEIRARRADPSEIESVYAMARYIESGSNAEVVVAKCILPPPESLQPFDMPESTKELWLHAIQSPEDGIDQRSLLLGHLDLVLEFMQESVDHSALVAHLMSNCEPISADVEITVR